MMNRPSVPTPNQPPSGLPGAAPAAQAASGAAPAVGSVISSLPGPGPVGLADGPPAELAATLPPGNVVILGGPGSGKTALLEAAMHHLLARPGGTARFLTSSRQAAVASTERLLAALTGASGGQLGWRDVGEDHRRPAGLRVRSGRAWPVHVGGILASAYDAGRTPSTSPPASWGDGLAVD